MPSGVINSVDNKEVNGKEKASQELTSKEVTDIEVSIKDTKNKDANNKVKDLKKVEEEIKTEVAKKEIDLSQFQKWPNTGNLIEVDGKILHYERVGTGKTVVLLMPGLMGSSRSDFPEQLELMDAKKFTLIAWDPPGYGFSRAQERVYNKTVYEDDAHLAAAMMKKIGFNQYSVLGWSDGGKTALNLAANYIDNVEKVVVWGVVCYRTPQTDKAFYLTKDVENFFDKQMAQRFGKVYGDPEYKKFWCKLVDDCYRAGIGRDSKIIPETLLKKIHCPSFILHGLNDPMVKKEQVEYLNKNLVDSETHYFSKASHNCHQTCAKEFNNLITMFLLE